MKGGGRAWEEPRGRGGGAWGWGSSPWTGAGLGGDTICERVPIANEKCAKNQIFRELKMGAKIKSNDRKGKILKAFWRLWAFKEKNSIVEQKNRKGTCPLLKKGVFGFRGGSLSEAVGCTKKNTPRESRRVGKIGISTIS